MAADIGAPVINAVLGITGALVALGNGEAPGEGTCEVYWVLHGKEVPSDTAFAERLERGGTGDLQMQSDDGKTAWFSSHHCRRPL